jgi:hypothetical protein
LPPGLTPFGEPPYILAPLSCAELIGASPPVDGDEFPWFLCAEWPSRLTAFAACGNKGAVGLEI